MQILMTILLLTAIQQVNSRTVKKDTIAKSEHTLLQHRLQTTCKMNQDWPLLSLALLGTFVTTLPETHLSLPQLTNLEMVKEMLKATLLQDITQSKVELDSTRQLVASPHTVLMLVKIANLV